MAKKKIADIKEKEPEVNLILNKRQIDLYRDDNGHLEGITIENLEIDNYNFRKLSLDGSIFKNSSFKKCLFQGVDLGCAVIVDCVFEGCDLRWASITSEQASANTFKDCITRELHVAS